VGRAQYILVFLSLITTVPGAGQSLPTNVLKKETLDWTRWLATPGDSIPFFLWDRLFNWEEMARRGLRASWVNLSAQWKDRMVAAIRYRVAMDGTAFLRDIAASAKPSELQWQTERIEDTQARVSCDFIRSSDNISLSFRMLLIDRRWQVIDVRSPDFRLRDFIRAFGQLISEGFSLEYVESIVLTDSIVHIDHFEFPLQGMPPKGWGWRKRDSDRMSADPSYFINRTSDGGELAAIGKSFPFVRPISYNTQEFPVLSWKWSLDSAGQSAAGPEVVAKMTVLFYQNWIGVPVTLSYLWTRSLPTCTTIQNPGWFFDDHEIVLQRGFNEKGWREENVNIVDDYTRIFGESPPNQCTGISVVVYEPYLFRFDDIVARKSTAALSCGK